MATTKAEHIVFCDLINAMLHENLLGFREKGIVSSAWMNASGSGPYPLDEGERYFYVPLDGQRTVMFRVFPRRFLQAYKISRLPVVLLTEREGSLTAQELHPAEFMRVVADSVSEAERAAALPNVHDFLDELSDAVRHTELSLAAMREHAIKRNEYDSLLLQMERFSALRDRPFHPTSRAKRGWNDDDYQRYSPEFGQSFGLDWIAVRRDHIQASTGQEAAAFILNESERETLRLAAARAGIDDENYLLLPVHPWQMEHVLPSLYQTEMARKICVPVIRGLGAFRATSSVRALAAPGNEQYHVKVPIGIYSLGALRVLPPRYLHNGQKGQALLRQLIEKDALLHNRLRVCDESNWWGYSEPDGDPFADKPGHLACLIREYPRDLLEDEQVDLIPMSALAVLDRSGENPVFAQWAAKRFGVQTGKTEVLALFREIAQVFVETTLTCFRYGIMPEVHGQNVLVIVRNDRACGLLLRDHDTIRVHLPWLEREGLADPAYVVKPGTPNSLINETPAHLLSYFQTLGVQVNLYAIADALSASYAIEEALFWQEIKSVIGMCLSHIDVPSAVRDVLQQQLMESETWPTRLLLTPLLKRTGTGGGSMPAGVGTTINPLKCVGAEDESILLR
jgi:siderophore synthetase component